MIEVISGVLLLPLIVGVFLLFGVLLFVAVSLWVYPVVAACLWSWWWWLAEIPVVAFYYLVYRRVVVGNKGYVEDNERNL